MIAKKILIVLTIIALTFLQESSLAAVNSTVGNYTVEKAITFVDNYKDSVNQTYRGQYHFQAPIGWINDPNGFVFFKGEYHLFYQSNPYDSVANKIHWGHAKSKDLINWEHLPVALAPDQEYDQDGVYSGSAIEKDGKLYVMYTGNNDETKRQVQCIAVSEDGINFEKIANNPVLNETHLPENTNPEHFRDPKVFERDGLYYVVLVSKTSNSTGQVLLYTSEDLIEWTYKSVVLAGTKDQGDMWECPDLYNLDSKDVLVLSPEKLPASGNDFRNYDSVVSFIGTMNWETGELSVEQSARELDHGMDYYATQSLKDDKNRTIIIGWMNMWKRDYPTHDLGHKWSGAMIIPRQLRIKNGSLVQTPIEEFDSYFPHIFVAPRTILNTSATVSFENISGEIGMLLVEVNLADSTLFEIDLRANDEEKTVLSYQKNTSEVILDRTESGILINGLEEPPVYSRRVQVALINDMLKLQVFLDKSSVEVFVNDGVETFSATIYPTKTESKEIRFRAAGTADIKTLRFSTYPSTTNPNSSAKVSYSHIKYIALFVFLFSRKFI